MPQLALPWDRAQVHALPDDGQRYELVDGALLVSPATGWRHQYAVAAFYRRLHERLERCGLGVGISAPADLAFDGPHLLQPDVFVAPLVGERRPGPTCPEILIDRLEWQPDSAQEPMVIDLAALFAEIGEA